MGNLSLNDLNILTLRELARQVGVSSPTSKKKDQLIAEIKSIQSGEMKPYSPKTKQGRPPKSAKYDMAEMFDFNPFYRNTDPVLSLKQNHRIEEKDIVTKRGYVEILENNTAFLWVNENFVNSKYFINNELVQNFNLQMGDLVVANVTTGQNRLVNDIYNINDNAVLEMTRPKKSYGQLETQLPYLNFKFEDEKFDKFNIKHGENVYFYGENNNSNTKVVLEMLKSSIADNKIYINLSLIQKNKLLLKDVKGIEFLTTELIEDKMNAQIIVKLAIERAKRAMEQNKKVVLAVDDMLSVLAIDDANMSLVKQLVSLAADAKRSGKITVFAVVNLNKELNIIDKLADKKLKIQNDEIVE